MPPIVCMANSALSVLRFSAFILCPDVYRLVKLLSIGAASKGYVNIVKMLIDQGAAVDLCQRKVSNT